MAHRAFRPLLMSASLLALGACQTMAPMTDTGYVAPAEAGSPISALAEQVAIDHQSFKLDNGLTVLVHEDRKAPIVAVSMWYNVGSKDEPKGKTGFAHLFEHLMFNGSENLPDDYFKYTSQIGATQLNGTTWYDRTNYFQNVPTGALERALFMESDRMGYLLGAVDQTKLTNQIGVVQNEKRQSDNRPGGLVEYAAIDALYPEGHPYGHSTIGSMADLSSATMGDVQQWFIDKYAPNNAVLVLAGDVDAATAKTLVQKYFGAIPSGPVNTPAEADVPTLSAPKRIVMKDRVATTQVQKKWVVGGLNAPDREALMVASQILGGLNSSRFDNKLVRGDEVAVRAWSSYQPFHRIGELEFGADVKPGVDPAKVESMLNAIVADFVVNGPSQDEVDRAVTKIVAGEVRGLERIGGFSGKANTLAEGLLYEGDSDAYATALANYAKLTPEMVRAAAAHWIARPSLTIELVPGAREPYAEPPKTAGAGGLAAKEYKKTPREIPAIGTTPSLDFPDVQHVTLSNGVKLEYAMRDAVPLTEISLVFDAGRAADPIAKRGLSTMTLGMLDEGAGGLSAQQIAEEEERLGASISANSGLDESAVRISSLSTNLGETLALAGKLVKAPTFAPADLERSRTQRLAAIAQAKNSPDGLRDYFLPRIAYGENHPYGSDALGTKASVSSITRDDLVGYQQAFLRPETMKVFVVSNLPLDTVKAALEAEFGNWTVAGQPGTKSFPAAKLVNVQRDVILVDRPDSPQSIIAGYQFLPLDPKSDIAVITAANEALGGDFLARMNMDLRETKGWSYGVFGQIGRNDQAVYYGVNAPVQSDRTADSLLALRSQIDGYLGANGTTDEELARIKASNIAALPGQFETAGAVLGAMIMNERYDRPDDYYETLSELYSAQTREGFDKAMRDAVKGGDFTWLIVGDAAKVAPQLKKAGIKYSVMKAD